MLILYFGNANDTIVNSGPPLTMLSWLFSTRQKGIFPSPHRRTWDPGRVITAGVPWDFGEF
jgi:hypothetical protein